jgi:hypothetical protein
MALAARVLIMSPHFTPHTHTTCQEDLPAVQPLVDMSKTTARPPASLVDYSNSEDGGDNVPCQRHGTLHSPPNMAATVQIR